MKMFSVLASLARAANPWLSKATCPCKSTLRYCGCVTLPPVHIDVLTQSHVYRTQSPAQYQFFLRYAKHLLVHIDGSYAIINLSGAVYGLAVT